MYEAVLTVCLSMPIGCVQESGTEYPGSEADGAATAVVTLQVGAAGNVQTRAYGGDGAACHFSFFISPYAVADHEKRLRVFRRVAVGIARILLVGAPPELRK